MKNTRMIRREWYASHGICVECGQREAEPHKRKCWECSEKKAEYNRKYNANMTPEQKEKNSIRHKKCMKAEKPLEFASIAERNQRHLVKLHA